MRQTTLAVLTGLALSCSAQAASFDCAKARTQVEKLICSDAELSKLDDDLAVTYSNAQKGNSSLKEVQNTQKQWVKERNNCLFASCLIASYNQRISALKVHSKANRNSVEVMPTNSTATAQALAPFHFTQNETLPEQSKTPICKDFKNYLNHPRSNELFKPDGTLVRESDLFKSVIWETLDKEQYRAGFSANLEATRPKRFPDGAVVHELRRRYASPDWALQRTLAYPFEYVPKPNQPERWIFRLVNLQPYTRNMADPKSKVELPTWFHYDEEALLGYEDGSPLGGNTHDLGRATPREWIAYAGLTYAVINRTYGNEKGTTPSALRMEIDQLNVDPSGQSFMHFTCSFRANNSQ